MWRGVLLVLGLAIGIAGAAVWIANRRFDRQVDSQIEGLFSAVHAAGHVVTEGDLTPLPEPVRRWLRYAGVIGKPMPSTVRLRQVGRIRLGPESPWMPFRADQYYTLDPVAFVWRVSASMVPGLFVRGVDAFTGGLGRMQMKPLALFSVVDASGPSLDQGSALRYLQEIVWFPFAALSSHISWETIDDSHAKATLHGERGDVDGVFAFGEDGRVVSFEADRYRDEKPEAVLRPWRALTYDDAKVSGIRIPRRGKGIWVLDDSPFSYVEIEIVEIDLDTPVVYPR